jgi:hypothetical protein
VVRRRASAAGGAHGAAVPCERSAGRGRVDRRAVSARHGAGLSRRLGEHFPRRIAGARAALAAVRPGFLRSADSDPRCRPGRPPRPAGA